MGKVLCLGEVALHNWTEYLVKEQFITHYNRGCPNGFNELSTYSFDPRHRIYDKKYLLFCMVLFDKFITPCPSNFVYDKVADTEIIDDDFFAFRHNMDPKEKEYFQNVSVDFIQHNKQSLINYLTKDIVHSSGFTVDPLDDYSSFFLDPFYKGIQPHFNPNIYILRKIRDGIENGLFLSQKENVLFYNGRLSYINKKHQTPDISSKFSDYVNLILQLDLTPEINQFPIPQNMVDVLYLRKQPSIISFRDVFFHWVDCISNGEYDIASKIKKDVLSANKALEKYRDFEKKKTSLFRCTIDAIVGQIPYLSNFLSSISPYSLRKTLKEKNENSWVTLLR